MDGAEGSVCRASRSSRPPTLTGTVEITSLEGSLSFADFVASDPNRARLIKRVIINYPRISKQESSRRPRGLNDLGTLARLPNLELLYMQSPFLLEDSATVWTDSLRMPEAEEGDDDEYDDADDEDDDENDDDDMDENSDSASESIFEDIFPRLRNCTLLFTGRGEEPGGPSPIEPFLCAPELETLTICNLTLPSPRQRHNLPELRKLFPEDGLRPLQKLTLDAASLDQQTLTNILSTRSADHIAIIGRANAPIQADLFNVGGWDQALTETSGRLLSLSLDHGISGGEYRPLNLSGLRNLKALRADTRQLFGSSGHSRTALELIGILPASLEVLELRLSDDHWLATRDIMQKAVLWHGLVPRLRDIRCIASRPEEDYPGFGELRELCRNQGVHFVHRSD